MCGCIFKFPGFSVEGVKKRVKGGAYIGYDNENGLQSRDFMWWALECLSVSTSNKYRIVPSCGGTPLNSS